MGHVTDNRLAELERRLDTSPDWRPDPGDFAQAALWERGRRPDGSLGKTHWPATCFPLEDLANGNLRPTTWAAMVDCLQLLASEVLILVLDAEPGEPRGPLPPASKRDKARLEALLSAALMA